MDFAIPTRVVKMVNGQSDSTGSHFSGRDGRFGENFPCCQHLQQTKSQTAFEFTCWLTVSQHFVIEELFRVMVKEAYKQATQNHNHNHSHAHDELVDRMERVDTMDSRALMETLVQYLQPRRYLIVLDDVWSVQFWDEISKLLPEGINGSRIMITTRKQDVAAASKYGFVSYVHQIQPLRLSELWQLFCKRAFTNDSDGCPSHLDSLARDLVERCEGLPLAIVALGGLITFKKSTAE